MWGNKWYSQTGHRWQLNTAHALCLLYGYGYRHELRRCDILRFTTSSMVETNAPQYYVIRTLPVFLYAGYMNWATPIDKTRAASQLANMSLIQIKVCHKTHTHTHTLTKAYQLETWILLPHSAFPLFPFLRNLTCQSLSPLTPPGQKLVSTYSTKHLSDNNWNKLVNYTVYLCSVTSGRR